MPALIALFVAGALAGAGLTAGLRPPEETPPRGAPVAGSVSVEGRFPDPYGLPPAVDRDSPAARRRDWPEPPPWAVLVWRTRDGRTCHEPGQVVDDSTPGRGDQIPGVHATDSTFAGAQVGSIRPDYHSGTGIQFYNLGRFLPYPTREGGSCGHPQAGAGLLLAYNHLHERRDLGPSRTIVSGVAGAEVDTVRVGARRLPLSPRRAFIAVFDGLRRPPATVTYRDGRATIIR